MTKKNHILTSHPEAFAEGSGERFFAFAQNDKVRDCHATLAMTEQRGRSMVEMLGVLAVIGVLSVAGIAGYSIAMRSYRTNEIVNAASMFYVLAKAQNQGNGPSGNTDYETLGGTNPSGASLTYTDNAFTITFTDSDDCTMAANKLGDKATADCANKKITVNFGEGNSTETIQKPEEGTPCDEEGYHCIGGILFECDAGTWRENYVDNVAFSDGTYIGKICKGNNLVDDTENEYWRCNNGIIEVKYYDGGDEWVSYTETPDYQFGQCAFCKGNIPTFLDNDNICWCDNGTLMLCTGEASSMDCEGKACNGNTLIDI